ncbi:MAG: hypothetical protein K2P48_03910, partial [Lachnospiraceae bacterium]|nr:hypothetical protein [Lachnospiraceae bacterium]
VKHDDFGFGTHTNIPMEILFYQSMTCTLGLCIIQDDLSSLYSSGRLYYKYNEKGAGEHLRRG